MLDFDEFLRELRQALNHLYEPEILRLSPLASMIAPDNNVRSSTTLGARLIKAIESLKPPATAAGDSPAWQTYEFLFYRYVHGASQADLARQLNCSVRQIRRLQTRALVVLAERLLQDLNLTPDRPNRPDAARRAAATAADRSALKSEYDAVVAHHQGSGTEVAAELIAIGDVIQHLLQQYQVALYLPASDGFANADVPDVVFRQAVLSLFARAAHFAAGGAIDVSYLKTAEKIQLQISLSAAKGHRLDIDVQRDFEEATSLFALCSGTLEGSAECVDRFMLNLHLPAVRYLSVLAIDDNPDILQLLARYTDGTRYQLTRCSDPATALRLASELVPAAVTLDVMMAGIDGWQLIRQLRQLRRLAEIPIVVCSVLAQGELALSLGANAYLRKPVSQQAYLATLDRLTSETATPLLPGHQ